MAELEPLAALVAVLKKRIEELEARLAQNSSNSSRPPSSDPPGAPPGPSREPSGRPRGGQSGHKPHQRTLLGPDQVRSTREVKPKRCRRCGDALFGHDPNPYRHQVIDIPEVVAFADEYRLHALFCPRCHITTRADLPPGVPCTMIGPRLQAVISVSSGAYRMSKRLIAEMIAGFFHAKVSLGTISHEEQRTSEALASAVDEVKETIPEEPVVHADETSWREAKKKAWLWVAATATMAVFLIRRSRGTKVAQELLGGKFGGILNSDRWCGYAWVDTLRRQVCWAHLIRHWKAFEDHVGEARRLGVALQFHTERLFRYWHRVRDGTLPRHTFQERVRPPQRTIVTLLSEGTTCGSAKVEGMCREILLLRDALWTFARVEGVEPTNNLGERVLRHAVVWRKSSYGTDSETGSRFVERMLTTVQTLRLQKRNVLEYVTDACDAANRGLPHPSLLPITQAAQAAA